MSRGLVDGRDRPQRRLQRVAPHDPLRPDAARERREDERFADRLAHRLRLQPLEHRRERQRRSPRRHDEVTQQIERARRSPARVADRIPAIGNQPVRAARNTSNSDVSSGGSDSSTSDIARIDGRQRAAAAAAGDDAERKADEGGDSQRGDREDRGVGRAFGHQIADRPVVQQRVAEIESDRARRASRDTARQSTCRGRSARAAAPSSRAAPRSPSAPLT